MRGKKQIETDSLCCGDIGMTAKLVNTNTNDTLTASSDAIKYAHTKFPTPYYSRGIQPLSKGDEDKISLGINRLLEEDLTLKYENNPETKQILISGLGDIHLDVIVSKLKNRFGTSVMLTDPKIAYREAIKKKVQAEERQEAIGRTRTVRSVRLSSHGEEKYLYRIIFGGSVPKNFPCR